jgi:hypothetical protein
MRNLRGRGGALLLLVLVAAAAAAQDVSFFAELEPLPLAASVGAMGEPLPLDTLVDAALAFSGTPDAEMDRQHRVISGHIRAFRQEAGRGQDEARLGEMALAYLHKNILQTYRVLQTRVDTALDAGSFNCVSSAVLYVILARSVGLSVGGVRTSDHAFCTVEVEGAPLDVESTHP